MGITAFIPSRYGSTRLPAKPLALIDGKPMIRHVYQCAVACPDISDVYVVTDDKRISGCVEDFGGKAIMTGKEHQSGTDRIAEAVQILGLNDDDLVVNVQGDQPLFDPSVISVMVAPLVKDPDLPMGTVKYRLKEASDITNVNIVKVVVDNDDFALYFSRSPIPFYREQASGNIYYKHLGFYAYRKRFLLKFTGLPSGRLETAEKLEQLRALEYGYRIKVMETIYDSVEVDIPDDIQKVERTIKLRGK
ncbi:MAG: 3-deoxy-manno-octulosonate cytidylyltransferase [Deltaproteobacteria bacterium]|nr:3-deoxy-manno-octulosonate cytidylyltransferase [Deltaproteobacteria bacterium]